MRLIFFGSGAFGLPTLERLSKHHDIAAVVSQPDRAAGRGGALTPTPIAEWAAKHLPGVPLLKPVKVNDPAIVSELRSKSAEAWVIIAFGQKLGKSLLHGIFAINLHASLLPRWRGAAPINAAILGGDTVSGNSVITLADRMDAGMILGQSQREIYPLFTAGELHDLLSQDGPDLVEKVLASHAAGAITPREQNEADVTIAPKLSKADAWVDFAATAESCRRRIQGLTPWPGITVQFRDLPLKLTRAEVPGENPEEVSDETEPSAPGTIIDADAGLIACGEGTTLRIMEVHPAGRKNMSWPDFARGHRIQPGERLIGKQS